MKITLKKDVQRLITDTKKCETNSMEEITTEIVVTMKIRLLKREDHTNRISKLNYVIFKKKADYTQLLYSTVNVFLVVFGNTT